MTRELHLFGVILVAFVLAVPAVDVQSSAHAQKGGPAPITRPDEEKQLARAIYKEFIEIQSGTRPEPRLRSRRRPPRG